MKDYIEHLDKILSATGENVLQNAGRISHKKAMHKVDAESKIYQEKPPTPVEKAYLDTIKSIESTLKTKSDSYE